MKLESIISFYDRESPEATEFRRLYSNIRGLDGNLKTVMITSSMVEEGKSLISSFLALTIAENTRQKILLLDSDLRRPMINVLFKLPLENGLSDLLEGKSKIPDLMKTTPVPELKIITAGKVTGSPTGILNPIKLHEVFDELKFYFDYIVVDAPPVIPVSDPLIIANEVDGVLMVVRAGSTPKEVVKRAVNLLNNSKVRVLGTVLNNIEEVLPYYYSSKYYSYKYYHKEQAKSHN
ncbi:MAG: CpsD/CapB family tyrosine-protein kinase [candidate division Zixibacteria bacterium]|nr:CpsD/CapB family tyrosine-protein kinase [candidate division Zixibacteria bacterium]